MPRLNKTQIMYLIAGAALMVALLVSYKALAGLLLLVFATPAQDMRDKRRAAVKAQLAETEQDAKEQERAEQTTQEAKTEAGKRASKEVDSFIDGGW